MAGAEEVGYVCVRSAAVCLSGSGPLTDSRPGLHLLLGAN